MLIDGLVNKICSGVRDCSQPDRPWLPLKTDFYNTWVVGMTAAAAVWLHVFQQLISISHFLIFFFPKSGWPLCSCLIYNQFCCDQPLQDGASALVCNSLHLLLLLFFFLNFFSHGKERKTFLTKNLKTKFSWSCFSDQMRIFLPLTNKMEEETKNPF